MFFKLNSYVLKISRGVLLTIITLANASALAKDPFRPDALLQIDLNRAAVIEKITATWKSEIPAAQFLSFKRKLSGLRADQLLAATLSGSFDGVLEVMSSHEAAQMRIAKQSLNTLNSINANDLGTSRDQSKALGDVASDLVYTPISTCRFVETRNVYANFGIPHFGAGQFAANEERTYALASACGLPAGVAAVVGQVQGQATAGAGANVEATRAGGPFGGGLTVVAANSPLFTVVSTAIPVNASNNSIGVKVTVNTAHLVIDLNGYFKAPGGVIGDITDIQTAAGSGLTGGVTSGAANLALASTFKLPQTCANQQVAKFNTGSGLWECQNDLQGTGGGAGTVTNIATGAGLTGGPITTTGTISADTTFLQRRVSATCAAGSSIRAIAADGTVTCQTDSAGPTNAWTQGGNAFGAPGIIGTTDAQNLTVQSGGNQASLVVTGGNGLRVIQTTGAYVGAPNTVNGSSVNTATAQGSTVAGGGEASTNCFNPATGTAIRNCRNEASADVATVGGGISNVALSIGATVGGGASNSASNQLATIAGGRGHRASGEYSAIGGGNLNEATNQFATVAGGGSSKASGQYAAVGGGNLNEATNIRATVAGGFTNRATGASSVVGGGHTNTASFDASTVSGGLGNTASGGYAAIGGGQANTASAAHSTVGGGQNNITNGADSVVGGGQNNTAAGPHSTISGGIGAATRLHGQYARAAGSFDANTPGLAQHSEYVLRRETTDAVPYAVRLNSDGTDRLSLEAGRAATVDIMVVGLQQGAPHRTASFAFKCNAQNVSGGIVLVQPAGCNRQIIWQDDPAWNAYIPVPATPGALDIVVQGVANTTIRWVATVRAVEVKW